jgi:hypothetical protein
MSCESSLLFIIENFIENSFIYSAGFLTGAFAMMMYSDHRRRTSFWQLFDSLPNLMDIDFQMPNIDHVVEVLRSCGIVVNASTTTPVAATTVPGAASETFVRPARTQGIFNCEALLRPTTAVPNNTPVQPESPEPVNKLNEDYVPANSE